MLVHECASGNRSCRRVAAARAKAGVAAVAGVHVDVEEDGVGGRRVLAELGGPLGAFPVGDVGVVEADGGEDAGVGFFGDVVVGGVAGDVVEGGLFVGVAPLVVFLDR